MTTHFDPGSSSEDVRLSGKFSKPRIAEMMSETQQDTAWLLMLRMLPASAAALGGFVEGLTGFGSAIVMLFAAQLILLSDQLGVLRAADKLPPALLEYKFWTAAITICQVR